MQSWWPVAEFVGSHPSLAGVVDYPAAGTPAWCALGDADPRKLAAVLMAGLHDTFQADCRQAALAEASRAVAAAADWSELARQTRARHSGAYIRRVVG
jgi:hypothetical protein